MIKLNVEKKLNKINQMKNFKMQVYFKNFLKLLVTILIKLNNKNVKQIICKIHCQKYLKPRR